MGARLSIVLAIAALTLSACGANAPKVYTSDYKPPATQKYVFAIDARGDTGELGRNQWLAADVKSQVIKVLQEARYDVIDSADVPSPNGDSSDQAARVTAVLTERGITHALIASIGATDRWANVETRGTNYHMPVTCEIIDVAERRGTIAKTTVNGYERQLNFVGRQAAVHSLAGMTDINSAARVYPEAIIYACQAVLAEINKAE